MNNNSEENYRAMLTSFQISDLQQLLKTFGKSITGRRSELQNVALDMLSSKPIGLNYGAYLIKILEIHNGKIHGSMQPQQRRIMYMDHTIQVPQQRKQTYINLINAKYTIPGNAMANNNIKRVPGSYLPIRPNNTVPSQFPSNQQNYMSHTMTQNSVRFNLKTMDREKNILLTLTPEIVAQYKFKKLPFYEVIGDIIKPALLSGSENCSLAKFSRGNSIFYLYD